MVALPREGGPLQGGVHRVQAAQEGVHLLEIEQAVFAQFQVASLSEKEGTPSSRSRLAMAALREGWEIISCSAVRWKFNCPAAALK